MTPGAFRSLGEGFIRDLDRLCKKYAVRLDGTDLKIVPFLNATEQSLPLLWNKQKKEYEVDYEQVPMPILQFFLKNELTVQEWKKGEEHAWMVQVEAVPEDWYLFLMKKSDRWTHHPCASFAERFQKIPTVEVPIALQQLAKRRWLFEGRFGHKE